MIDKRTIGIPNPDKPFLNLITGMIELSQATQNLYRRLGKLDHAVLSD